MKTVIAIAILIGCVFCVGCSKTEQVVKQTANTENGSNGGMQLRSEGFCDEGDNEDPQPMLSGNVYDSLGGAVYHACVELKTTGGTLVASIGTNSSGHYYFNTVSNASYNLVVSRSGYVTKTTPVTISGTPQTVNVILNQ